MENNKTLQNLEKVKAMAIGFIAAGFMTQGIQYLRGPQTSYHVPRILLPVFEHFGSNGLSIGMIILGFALAFYGYHKWKKAGGMVVNYGVALVVSALVFAAILFFMDKKKAGAPTATEIRSTEARRQQDIEEVKAMAKPKFSLYAADDHFARFEGLFTNYKKNVADHNLPEIQKSQEALVKWNEEVSEIMPQLSPNEKKDFALYNGKLMIQWQALSN